MEDSSKIILKKLFDELKETEHIKLQNINLFCSILMKIIIKCFFSLNSNFNFLQQKKNLSIIKISFFKKMRF